MSINFNVAGHPSIIAGFGDETLENSPEGNDAFRRLLVASRKIPGLTFVSRQNLEVLEHLGAGLDLIVTGPERLASITCAALPAIAGAELVVVVGHSIQSIRRMKTRFEALQICTESFDLAPTKEEKRIIWEAMDRGEVQLLLVTPGRLSSERFCSRLRRRTISVIVIDQAQLMSPWSHKFVPSYRFVGEFLASLDDRENTALTQKVAIIWNPNGRMTKDLTNHLSLKSPQHGRLTAEALPGLDIEFQFVTEEAEREKFIVQELERSGGQGVIYCNSIKQIYDTAALLESRHEEFAVIRPGLHELEINKIRRNFEDGSLRIVVVIGVFLSDVETAHGLEFCVFNGMPESVEMMGRELLGVEDAGFIRCIVLVGGKDYYHHRFAIDKNYPDPLALRACVQGIRDIFGHKNMLTPQAMLTHLALAIPFPSDEIELCMQVLFREGVLKKILDSVTNCVYVAFTDTAEGEADFWHEYPIRKIHHIARLDQMRDFTTKGHETLRHLQNLIR